MSDKPDPVRLVDVPEGEGIDLGMTSPKVVEGTRAQEGKGMRAKQPPAPSPPPPQPKDSAASARPEAKNG